MDEQIKKILHFLEKKNFVDAETICSEVYEQYSNNPEYLNIYAVILFELKKYNDAINKWKKAIFLNSNFFNAYENLGSAYLELKKYRDAISNYNQAIKINSKSFKVFNNRGNALSKLNKLEEALLSYDKAIEINPNDIYAYIFKAHIFSEQGKFEEALLSYKNAYYINPEHPLLLGYIVNIKTKICDWDDYQKNIDKIKISLENGKNISFPFTTLMVGDFPDIHRLAAKIWSSQYENLYKKKNIKLKNKNKKKIRVGYYSADFRNHATAYLITEMLEKHDKSKFEVFGFYLGRSIGSEDLWHDRVKKTFDKFFDVSSMTEFEISELSIKEEIDIAIDLMTHVNNGMENRFGAFTIGCAPLQINFLGYPGTSGSKSIDYIIADKNLIPSDCKKFYSEKIIYLPNSYQPNIKNIKISESNLTREKLGLPKDKFIFCSFNQHQKINPKIYDIWMSILNKNPNSILWLLNDNIFSNKNLLLEAKKRGIEEKRIIFGERFSHADHLERIKFGDLFLDTFPCTAHTTCSDALRVGLPVLTISGSSFVSRVATSLLNTMNLKELISNNFKEYEIIANKIVSDTDFLDKIKFKIKKNVLDSPLYNAEIFTKNLEIAYEKVFKNYIDNKDTRDFEI